MRSDNEIAAVMGIDQVEDYMPGLTVGVIRLPDSGVASVVWSRNENGYEHVSVAPSRIYKVPTWKDMCYVKELFGEEDEEVYQIHPKKADYVNIKENCLHLWRVTGHELHELTRLNSTTEEEK